MLIARELSSDPSLQRLRHVAYGLHFNAGAKEDGVLLNGPALLNVLQPLLLAAALSEQAKPKLSLRAAPRTAPAPAQVVFTAELTGGEDLKEWYCPSVEWEWGDGSKSVQQEECPPFEKGVTPMQRHFTADREFGVKGRPRVRVTLKRDDNVLASASIELIVSDRPRSLTHRARVP
jgi:hypothetical protein